MNAATARSHRWLNRQRSSIVPALAIRNLFKEYAPGKPVLHGISLDISERGITAIIGPSGTGKSTLIRCINRLVEPSSGEILFEGEDMVKLDRRGLRRARRHIGMVFQEFNWWSG